jgi:hypothetical protein
MPDADKIGTFSRRWSRVYRKVSEGYFDNDLLAEDAMSALMKDIKNYGDAPIRFLKQASTRLENIQANPLFRPIHSWKDEDHFIRSLASSYMQLNKANQRAINLAISAFKGALHKLRNGETLIENLQEMLCHDYIRRIYDSNFIERIPFAENYNLEQNQEKVNQKISELDDLVEDKITDLAERISQKGNTGNIRKAHRSLPRRPITLEDDVFDIGSGI